MMFVLFCLYCFLNCFLFAGEHDGAALFDTCSLFFVSFSFSFLWFVCSFSPSTRVFRIPVFFFLIFCDFLLLKNQAMT